MANIILYIAVSVDGFIAPGDGSVAWLEPFQDVGHDYGYGEFMAGIATVVMGRRTYEQVLTFGEWPYAGKKSVVLTSRPLGPGAPEEVRAHGGDIGPLVEQLRGQQGDVWIDGGGEVVRPFVRAGALDRLELFVMPVLLGNGVRLFPDVDGATGLRLVDSHAYENGVVGLVYGREGSGGKL